MHFYNTLHWCAGSSVVGCQIFTVSRFLLQSFVRFRGFTHNSSSLSNIEIVMKMKCHTHFNLMYCYYLFFLSFLTAVNCNVHSQSVVQAQDGSNILTVVLNADFKSQKYMTSIEMGQICHNFVLDNMKLFSFTNVDEVYILRTANDICSHYAAENGREYVAIDFLRSLYPYVRRNELTNIFDKYMTGRYWYGVMQCCVCMFMYSFCSAIFDNALICYR